MNKFIGLTLMGLSLGAGVSYADTYDFAYQFGDGNTATGTFTGTQNGNFIDNISGVTLAFNGTPVAGPIFTGSYVEGSVTATGNPGVFQAGPVVSFDATFNNFVFANVDPVPGGTGPGAKFFSMFQTGTDALGDGNPFAFEGVPSFDIDDPTISANWSLTDTTASIPDGGATVVMLGTAMTALGFIRRKA